MRQAIVTKFFGPTNSKGSRIKASCEAGSIWFEYNHRYNSDQNHMLAVLSLLRKLGWKGWWTVGGTPTGCVAVDHSGDWENGFEVSVSDNSGRPLTFRDLAQAG